MSELTISSHQAGAAPTPPNPTSTLPGARASLETLLAEVAALANQLKKTTALMPQQDNSPQGGSSILHTLGRLGPQTVPDIATSLEGLLRHVPQSRLVPAARLLRRLRELLAGPAFPPAETDEAHPVHKPANMPRKPARRRKAASETAKLPAATEPIEPDEGEFPVNLL